MLNTALALIFTDHARLYYNNLILFADFFFPAVQPQIESGDKSKFIKSYTFSSNYLRLFCIFIFILFLFLCLLCSYNASLSPWSPWWVVLVDGFTIAFFKGIFNYFGFARNHDFQV